MGDRETIERALREAEEHLARMPDTPVARELGARLKEFRRALESWQTREPTPEQAEALREGVAQAQRLAKRTSPTVKIRK